MEETAASTAHRTQYEFAAAHTPDSGPTPLEAAMAAEEDQARDCGPHCPVLPQQLRKVMVAIMAACANNERRIAICMTRLGGMSLSQAGACFGGITKQGVDKHLAAIARRNPALGELLRKEFRYDAALCGMDVDTAGTISGIMDFIRQPGECQGNTASQDEGAGQEQATPAANEARQLNTAMRQLEDGFMQATQLYQRKRNERQARLNELMLSPADEPDGQRLVTQP